jgi:hypothetical protein
MLVLSFAAMAEEAAAISKNLSGNIRRLEDLAQPEVMAKMRDFARVYCFLAFHGVGDDAVAEYVRSGTLADDSGPDVLVLFVLDEPAPVALPLGADSLRQWGNLERGVHPAYEMVRTLFDGRPAPPLPGLLVLEDLAVDGEAVYVPLTGLTTAQEVRDRLRLVFSLLDHAAAKTKVGRLLDDVSVALRARRINSVRTDRRSFREWLLQGVQLAREHLGDIVAVIGLLK